MLHKFIKKKSKKTRALNPLTIIKVRAAQRKKGGKGVHATVYNYTQSNFTVIILTVKPKRLRTKCRQYIKNAVVALVNARSGSLRVSVEWGTVVVTVTGGK